MQQVEIQIVGIQLLQAALTGFNRAATGRIGRQDLGDEVNLLAPALNSFTHDALDRTGAVHLGRIDVAQA